MSDFHAGLCWGAMVGVCAGVLIGTMLGAPGKDFWLEQVKRGYVISGGQVFYVDIGPTVDAAVRKGPENK